MLVHLISFTFMNCMDIFLCILFYSFYFKFEEKLFLLDFSAIIPMLIVPNVLFHQPMLLFHVLVLSNFFAYIYFAPNSISAMLIVLIFLIYLYIMTLSSYDMTT